ncbi:S8 family serine peptidase [Halorubrum alkaliphilum]|nr:S8 family serine peptidase [Halorubrum alkaliphilum]
MGTGGSGIHVGIADSAATLSDETIDTTTVVSDCGGSFIDLDEPITNPHAKHVFRQLKHYAPFIDVSFYQVIDDNGDLGVEAYHDAIDAAMDDEVDLLNLSLGDPWDVPRYAHPLYKKTQSAIEAGITIVAAAGHEKPGHDSKPPVHVPAVVDGVIAVNGFVSHCPESKDTVHDSEGTGPYYLEHEQDVDHWVPDGVYCGYNGCSGQSCIGRQTEENWPRNPRPSNGKPDVAAPVVFPVCENDVFEFKSGSSYAAPVVTGVLASAFGDILDEGGEIPTPTQAREIITSTASPLRDGDCGVVDGFAAHQRFKERYTSVEPSQHTG